MTTIKIIMRTVSMSCLLVSALFLVGIRVHAHDLGVAEPEYFDNNDKTKKTEGEGKYRFTAMPKTSLSLDASSRASGFLKQTFNLSSDNAVNVKSTMTIRKGNVTYILPYAGKVAPQVTPVPDMQYHHLQIKLPFRKG